MDAGDPVERPASSVLENPLRQVLYVLLWHGEASAGQLQEVVDRPLSRVNYHLKVLLDSGLVTASQVAGVLIYSAVRTIADQEADVPRATMLTLLDAAWAAVGATQSDIPVTPLWKVFIVDDVGLLEAVRVTRVALCAYQEIASASRERLNSGEDSAKHSILAAASLGGGDGSDA